LDENRIAASFAKNSREMIFVGVNCWKDKWRFFIRTYFPGSEDGQDWIPTKKGVSLEFDQYEPLVKAMHELGNDLESEREIVVLGKTATQEIRINLNYFKEMPLVNIRTYVEIDGEIRPTQKGVSLRTALFPQLYEAVEKLGELIKDISNG
jgi:hypothetical protein